MTSCLDFFRIHYLANFQLIPKLFIYLILLCLSTSLSFRVREKAFRRTRNSSYQVCSEIQQHGLHLNSDAAVRLDVDFLGTGGALWGFVVADYTRGLTHSFSLEDAKALALCYGLSFAVQNSFSITMVEYDALRVVQASRLIIISL